jgi:predicted nuclease of restriction endonuclease-like RecB superfamily
MLTGNLVRVRFARDRIVPRYLPSGDGRLLDLAQRLLDLYRAHVGAARGALAAEIDELFAGEPEPLVYRGLSKILEDRCAFEVDAPRPPDEVRRIVFRLAAQQRRSADARPSFDRAAVIAAAAAALDIPPDAVDAALFADLKSEQRLTHLHDLTPQRLIDRYNVALAQSVLLRSIAVEALVRGESPQRYRQLFRAIKFHRLLCDIERLDSDAYRLRLDGPLSLFSATQRYGLQLALFLPALLLCRNFELSAELRWGAERKRKLFRLSHEDGLVSHHQDSGMYVPPEIAMFADLFRKKAADWRLEEMTEVVPLPGRPWIPDFKLVHQPSGAVVYLEVLGYWRRASVEKHLAHLREHLKGERALLAISQQLHIGEETLTDVPAGVLSFCQMPLPEDIVAAAERLLQ